MAADSTPQALGLQDHSGAWRPWRLWPWCFLAMLVLIAIMFADGMLRARQADRQALFWFEMLDLSSVALYPTGTPQRHPETLWPGMETRFSPWMPGPPQKDLKP